MHRVEIYFVLAVVGIASVLVATPIYLTTNLVSGVMFFLLSCVVMFLIYAGMMRILTTAGPQGTRRYVSASAGGLTHAFALFVAIAPWAFGWLVLWPKMF